MILAAILPLLNAKMSSAVVESFYPAPDTMLPMGGKLLDIRVDLSMVVTHDCPPVSFFRLAVRERVWLRRVLAVRGQRIAVGDAMALFSTAPEEDPGATPQRALRISTAGIVHQADWWAMGSA